MATERSQTVSTYSDCLERSQTVSTHLERSQTSIKLREIELQTLSTEKLLKHWTSSEVILWLQLVNDGLFAKYTELFESKQIDGKALMTLDDDKQISQLLGTQHHSIVFVQCIKQLKVKTGRNRLSRKQKSRSLATLPFGRAQLFDIPDIVKAPRSSTPNSHYRSRSNRFKYPSSPPINPPKHGKYNSLPHYNLFHDDIQMETKDPTDKKALWKIYKSKQIYSAILFKRGKYNTSFKKRWLVLCEKKKKRIGVQPPTLGRPMSNSVLMEDDAKDAEHIKKRSMNMGKFCIGYLFYFGERPIKDSDFPNGFVDLSSVECVIGLLDVDNEVGNGHTDIKYLKSKAKDSEYYEIVLKTKDREWVFGAIDTSSYVEWLIRLKRYEK